MPDDKSIGLRPLIVKTAIVHTVTYFFAGITAMTLLKYGDIYSSPGSIMRPVTDPLVMAGPLLQPVRGVIFGLAFYPIRHTLFRNKRGWLILWWILVAIGILSTFGPAAGSIEGMIYTTQPITVFNYVEVVPQALALSFILCYWVNHADRKWLNRTLWTLFIIVMLLPALGLLMGK